MPTGGCGVRVGVGDAPAAAVRHSTTRPTPVSTRHAYCLSLPELGSRRTIVAGRASARRRRVVETSHGQQPAPLASRKILYAIGDTGFSLPSILIAVYFGLFLTDVVGLRPALAGLVMMIARQWDWTNDPLVGHLSDRTRFRWGRRRPILLFGALPFVAAFAMMWWRPPLEGKGRA